MSDGFSLINLGELAKPATVLIEKISDAIGGAFRPYQIKRIASAEAEADKIKAVAQIEIDELQRRALVRFVEEETKKQSNMESITQKALNDLTDDAQPQNVDDDWITNFFDKCRLISDDEMQNLWAKVLAGEANVPGKYSKRTVNFLSSMDKSDAALFAKLCSFGWFIGDVTPLIYNIEDAPYVQNGITFNALKHLDDIGLLTFETLTGYAKMRLPKRIRAFYYGRPVVVEFPNENNNQINTGKVILSKIGQELAPLTGSVPIDTFFDYVIEQWGRDGYVTFSEWPRNC